ncbi:MAG: sigma-70 family RNA polymerase sigma factor [Bryobacteraceae bacterium]
MFSELFRRHHSRITHWSYRYTGDHEAALDLTQEIFIKAFRSFHTFRGNSRFSTWIYVIARNHCLNSLKRRAHDHVELAPSVAARLADPAASEIHRKLETRQAFQKRWQWITSILTSVETRVMLLHFGLELPLDAVTRELGLTNRSGAKAFIVSARRKLAVALENWSGTEARPISLRKEPKAPTRRRAAFAAAAPAVM